MKVQVSSIFSGGGRLPFFYEKLFPRDADAVERQMQGRKFDASLILGTAHRCRFGYPQVIVCSPLKGLTPFPTSLWLTCPWLVRLAGEAESNGGVGKLERWIKSHASRGWIPFHIDHQRLRLALLPGETLKYLRRFRHQVFERIRHGGVGGIRYDRTAQEIRVKCLHLQTASWLALGYHPGEKWLEAQGLNGSCRDEKEMVCGREKGGASCVEGTF